jgi:hypothetical protein
MKMLSRVTYDNAFYTHQGWLNEDMSALLLNDELDESRTSQKNTRASIRFRHCNLGPPSDGRTCLLNERQLKYRISAVFSVLEAGCA